MGVLDEILQILKKEEFPKNFRDKTEMKWKEENSSKKKADEQPILKHFEYLA